MTKQELRKALERSQRKVAYLEGVMREISGVKIDYTDHGMSRALGSCQAKAECALANGDWYANRPTPSTTP